MPNHHPTDEQKMMAALEDAPTDLLEAELEKRKRREFLDEIPKLQVDPTGTVEVAKLSPLMDYCASYISQLADDEPYADDKLRQYIFEAAMEAFFGKDVFKWVNKRLR